MGGYPHLALCTSSLPPTSIQLGRSSPSAPLHPLPHTCSCWTRPTRPLTASWLAIWCPSTATVWAAWATRCVQRAHACGCGRALCMGRAAFALNSKAPQGNGPISVFHAFPSTISSLPPQADIIPMDTLRDYIAFARATCFPQLQPEAANVSCVGGGWWWWAGCWRGVALPAGSACKCHMRMCRHNQPFGIKPLLAASRPVSAPCPLTPISPPSLPCPLSTGAVPGICGDAQHGHEPQDCVRHTPPAGVAHPPVRWVGAGGRWGLECVCARCCLCCGALATLHALEATERLVVHCRGGPPHHPHPPPLP